MSPMRAPTRLAGVAAAWVALVVVYALALDSVAVMDLVLGGVIALAVLAFLRATLFPRPARSGPGEILRRLVGFPPLALAVARDVASGTWDVSLMVLGLRVPAAAGIVAVPMGERSDLGIAVASIIISLTPGEVVVELDWTRRVMLVHTIDAGDPSATRAAQQRFYDRYQRRVFP